MWRGVGDRRREKGEERTGCRIPKVRWGGIGGWRGMGGGRRVGTKQDFQGGGGRVVGGRRGMGGGRKESMKQDFQGGGGGGDKRQEKGEEKAGSRIPKVVGTRRN